LDCQEVQQRRGYCQGTSPDEGTNTMTKEPLELTRSNVREANLGDVDALQALDDQCFEYPCGKEYFEDALKSHGATVILVVTVAERIVAYASYLRVPKRNIAHVIRIGIEAPFRRRKIGTQLLSMIRRELDSKTKLCMYIQETDLIGQEFAKKNGLVCVQILPRYFKFAKGVYEAAYEFVYGGVVIRPQQSTKGGSRGELTVNLKNRFASRKGKSDLEDDDECETA